MPDTLKYIAAGLFGLVAGACVFGLATVYGRYQEAAGALNACNQECTARLSEYVERLERVKQDRASALADKDRAITELEAKLTAAVAEIDHMRSDRDAVSQAILARLDTLAKNVELIQVQQPPVEYAPPELGKPPGTEQERSRLERQGNREQK
jgi:hypothetical protein